MNVLHICANRMLNGDTIRLDGALRLPPKTSARPCSPLAGCGRHQTCARRGINGSEV